ncbi:MAG: hypothetical protein ACJ8KU_04455 [Chthoniobacterales bacterium]
MNPRAIALFVAVILAAGAAIASAKEHKPKKGSPNQVDWKDVPAVAQSAIQTNAGGGKVETVEKQTKNGITIYTAEVKEHGGNMLKVAVTDAGKLVKVKEDKRAKRKHRPLFGASDEASGLA